LFPNRGDLDCLTEGHRVRALLYGMGYAIAFYSTLMFVVHGTKHASSDSAARGYTAQMLSLDGGRVLVAFAGIVLVAGSCRSSRRSAPHLRRSPRLSTVPPDRPAARDGMQWAVRRSHDPVRKI